MSTPLRHLLSLPRAADADPSPPVLCFLHGYDEAAPLDLRAGVTRHGPLRAGSWPGAAERWIVVAPQLPVAGDHWRRHADDVVRLVCEVRDAHGGDPARCYLTGFSFGGNGVLDVALAHPEPWAALWPVDPTRVPPRAPGHPVWLSVGALARRRLPDFVRALALRPAAADPDGDRVWLDEGDDHVGSATRAYRDARPYAWLLARRGTSPAPGRAP